MPTKRKQERRVALVACLELLGPRWMVQEQVTSLGEGVYSEGEGIAPEENCGKPEGVCSFLRRTRVGQRVVGGTPGAAAEGQPRRSHAGRGVPMKQVRLRGRPGGW